MREAIGAAHVRGGVEPERRERVLALDEPLVQVVDAVGAEGHGAALLGANDDEADPGMLAQGRDQAGMQLTEPFQGHAAGLAREAHQPQTTRGHDHDLGQIVAGLDLGARLGAEGPAPPARRSRVAEATARPAAVSSPANSVSPAPR